MSQVLQVLQSIGTVVWNFLGSSFGVALISACAGALAGALAAQRIADRSKRREELLKELRSANAAITVAHSVANMALALKKQHAKPLYEHFQADKKRFVAVTENAAGRMPDGSADNQFLLDMRRLTFPEFPLEPLRALVFERISAQGRALALVAALGQAASGLRDAVSLRSKLIQEFADSGVSGSQTLYRYFGIRTSSGHTYQEFSDTLESIYSLTDDIIFSQRCCVRISRRTENAFVRHFSKRGGKIRPRCLKWTSPRHENAD